MVIYVDIDNTIANTFKVGHTFDYTKHTPRHEQIAKINKLFDEGHEIVYWTARGSGSGIDWSELTERQLNDWGCKYTRIETQKKPSFDLFIDDKSKRIEEI